MVEAVASRLHGRGEYLITGSSALGHEDCNVSELSGNVFGWLGVAYAYCKHGVVLSRIDYDVEDSLCSRWYTEWYHLFRPTTLV